MARRIFTKSSPKDVFAVKRWYLCENWSLRKFLELKTLIVGAKIQTPPSLEDRCAKKRRNSAGEKLKQIV